MIEKIKRKGDVLFPALICLVAVIVVSESPSIEPVTSYSPTVSLSTLEVSHVTKGETA